MSTVVELMNTGYIRVAANIVDSDATINKVYAFALSNPLDDSILQLTDASNVVSFITNNSDHVATMFDPNTGATSKSVSDGNSTFQVVGFISKSFLSIDTPTILSPSTDHYVYIVTQNNLGYNKVWKS